MSIVNNLTNDVKFVEFYSWSETDMARARVSSTQGKGEVGRDGQHGKARVGVEGARAGCMKEVGGLPRQGGGRVGVRGLPRILSLHRGQVLLLMSQGSRLDQCVRGPGRGRQGGGGAEVRGLPRILSLHSGQVLLLMSQGSTHFTWNSWKHGNTRIRWKSIIQVHLRLKLSDLNLLSVLTNLFNCKAQTHKLLNPLTHYETIYILRLQKYNN